MNVTRGALGTRINRYRVVLEKGHLLNTFGSLAVAGMLIMDSAGMAQAALPSKETAAVEMVIVGNAGMAQTALPSEETTAVEVVIEDVDAPREGGYTGTPQTALVFNDPIPSIFNNIALGFGTIQANYDVSVDNLCTGMRGNAETGIFAETVAPITVNVFGAGAITATHVEVADHQTLVLSGTLRISNILIEGGSSELVIHEKGKLIVMDGGILDISKATEIPTSEQLQLSAGATLIMDPSQIEDFTGAALDSGAVVCIASDWEEGKVLDTDVLMAKFGSEVIITTSNTAAEDLIGEEREEGTRDSSSI